MESESFELAEDELAEIMDELWLVSQDLYNFLNGFNVSLSSNEDSSNSTFNMTACSYLLQKLYTIRPYIEICDSCEQKVWYGIMAVLLL